RDKPPCPPKEHLWTIAAARVLLPEDVHVQAPPNLFDDFGRLLDAGIDDWGGVSPVTADHVNLERAWPAIERLRDASEERGYHLAPRLTVYPERVAAAATWISPALQFAVLDRSDGDGLGRDDPGPFFPPGKVATGDTGDGAT